MSLWVLHNNTRAIRFYEKLGLAQEKQEKLEQWQGLIPSPINWLKIRKAIPAS